MLTTDCPICDEPAFVEATLAAIDCAACGRLEFAADPTATDAPVIDLGRAA